MLKFLLTSLVALGAIVAQAQFPSYIQQDFQQQFDAFAAQHNLVGVSVSIRNSENNWTATDGISTAADPLNAEHKLAMGSISKTITSATILQMHEEGLLHLDDSVGQHLPLTPWVTPSITIRQLLNHTTGLFNYTQHSDFFADVLYNSSAVVNANDILTNYMQNGPFSPGQSWAYSNTNYIVLGMIIEAVAGQAYYLEARDRFAFDANYPTLSLPPHESSTDDLAHLWIDTLGNGTYFDWQESTLSTNMLFSSAGAAGAYVATPSDLSQWTYDLYAGALLQAATFLELLDTVPNSPGYGLGVMVNNGPCGQLSYGHNGGIFYRSAAFYSPTCDLAVVIQTNDANVPVNLDAFALDIFCSYSQIVSANTPTTSAPEVALYPNPANNMVSISYSHTQAPESIELIGIAGNIISVPASELSHNGSGQYTMDVAALPAGSYVVRLQFANGVVTKPLILVR